MTQFFEFIGLLLVFGSVLFLAYVTTKFVAKSSARAMKSNNIEVVETLKLGVDKQLFIVRAGNKYVLLSSSGKNIQLLCDVVLDEDLMKDQAERQTGVNDFKGVLSKYLVSLKPQENVFSRGSKVQKDEGTVQTNFTDNLKKLQNINKKINSEDVGHDN